MNAVFLALLACYLYSVDDKSSLTLLKNGDHIVVEQHKGVPYCDHPCYKNLFGLHALGKRVIETSIKWSPTPAAPKPEPLLLIMNSSPGKRSLL